MTARLTMMIAPFLKWCVSIEIFCITEWKFHLLWLMSIFFLLFCLSSKTFEYDAILFTHLLVVKAQRAILVIYGLIS